MLDEIIANKKKEVDRRKHEMPLIELKKRIARRAAPLGFALALGGKGTRLIAEVKKASPSRGVLCADFKPVELARTYAAGGAAAVSVLTEVNYFQGSLDHLVAVKEEVRVPVLRKDFIFDPYQVYESAAFGADALLLIAAILSQGQLKELLALSRSLNLDCLVEVHSEGDVGSALAAGAQVIGINNRDLATFKTDIETTRRLRPLVPEGRRVVSESGISSRRDVEKLRGWGVNSILVGEALVTAADIPSKMRELVLP